VSLSDEIPFWVARLELVGGSRLVRAPLFPEISWLTPSAPALTEAFTSAALNRWTRTGEVMPWLELTHPLALRQDTLAISLPAPRDSGLPDPLELPFDILIGQASEHLIGFVPALCVGGRGADEAALRQSLTDAVQLEFARKKRLKDARGVLSSQWFADCELIQTTATATFFTFAEVRQAQEARGEAWAPKIASRLRPARSVIFGVSDTLTELSRALGSPQTPCVVLVGPSGVGKSAIIAELARQSEGVFWQTSAAAMIRGLTGDTGWQENLAGLCEELSESGDWLVVQNLAELFEVGRYVGNSTSMAESLTPRISRGELRLITECTPEQAARLEARYPGFLDHFLRVPVEEPEALDDLLLRRAALEAEGIPITPGSVETLLRLLRRFSPYSGFPGRAVRFIEATCRALRERSGGQVLDSEAIFSRFCAETGMPRALIDPAVSLPVADIRSHFQRWIYGQPEAIDAVVQTLISVRAALTRPRRPIATLLFAGPTGVGKTETAKALAAFMFGSPDRMIRFDMSEFSAPGSALRLSDGPGGEGRLTGEIRRQPFSVVLLDEIEKADGMVFDLLLQVLGEGRLTDGQGRTADFCSSIIIMTSNIGAQDAARAPSGFSRSEAHLRQLPEIYTGAVQRHFRPEFFNRLDQIIAFAPLRPDAIAAVLERELEALSGSVGLRRRRAGLAITPEARDHLIDIGYDPAFGARHLQRALRRHLSAPASAALNATTTTNALTVHVTARDGALACRVEEHRQDRQALTARQRFEEAADDADTQRRVARRMLAGAAFAELRSSLSILKRRQRRLGQAFWSRTADVARLGRLEQIEADCLAMTDEIAALSLSTDMATLQGGGEAEPLEAALAEHRQRAREVRRALYEALTHDPRHAVVGIYGDMARVTALSQRYIAAAEALSLSVRSANLWLRADPDLPFPSGDTPEDLLPYPYLHSPPRDLQENPVTLQVGIELELTGSGASVAFATEEGILCWQETPEQRLLIRVDATDLPGYRRLRPTNLHRQGAVSGKPRLTFKDGQVTGLVRGTTLPEEAFSDGITDRITATFHDHILATVIR
jgi:hypothetical protein